MFDMVCMHAMTARKMKHNPRARMSGRKCARMERFAAASAESAQVGSGAQCNSPVCANDSFERAVHMDLHGAR